MFIKIVGLNCHYANFLVIFQVYSLAYISFFSYTLIYYIICRNFIVILKKLHFLMEQLILFYETCFFLFIRCALLSFILTPAMCKNIVSKSNQEKGMTPDVITTFLRCHYRGSGNPGCLIRLFFFLMLWRVLVNVFWIPAFAGMT